MLFPACINHLVFLFILFSSVAPDQCAATSMALLELLQLFRFIYYGANSYVARTLERFQFIDVWEITMCRDCSALEELIFFALLLGPRKDPEVSSLGAPATRKGVLSVKWKQLSNANSDLPMGALALARFIQCFKITVCSVFLSPFIDKIEFVYLIRYNTA